MKVFAPKRILYAGQTTDKYTGQRCAYGIPLDGDWEDHDDYFRQVSRGNDINDVVHAKVVDADGFDYSAGDLRDDAGRFYPHTIVNGSGSSTCLYAHCASFETQKVKVWRYPRNYKGKKPLQLRLYDDIRRVTHTALVKIRAYDQWYKIAPYIEIWYETHVGRPRTGYAYATYKSMRVSYYPDDRHPPYPKGYSLSDWALPYFGSVLDAAKSLEYIDYRSKDEWKVQACFNAMLPAVMAGLYAFLASVDPVSTSYSIERKPNWITSCEVDYFDHPELAFVLDEPEIYGNRLDPILLGKDVKFHNYWRNWLTQHALLAACESFPKLSDNSISNIIEVVGFIKALVVDHKIEMPSSLSQLWLAYRYQYSTTKLDVQEAAKFVRRYTDLGGLARTISCRGIATHDIEGTTVTCRCSIDVTPKDVGILDRILRALSTYGLTPDFYVIWDMIPYSFIVDWFLPVSDILATLDADAMYFSGEYYNLENVCFSLSYTRDLVTEDGSTVKCKCYTRWKGSIPPSLNSLYWLDAPSASSKTVQYRILDAASLFIGQ
jgi:hypothetical protein